MITITISGFKNKEEAIHWLNQYEGSVEQSFDTDEPTDSCFPAMTIMEDYIPEMEKFKKEAEKENFNLVLK